MITCQICGKNFKTLGAHVSRTHKMSNKEYYDTYCKTSEKEGECPVDKKPTTFLSIADGYATCCSISCSNIYTRPKREENNMKRYGVENPQQNAEIRKRTEVTLTNRYGGVGAASSIIMNKMQETNLEKYGAANVYSSDYGKAKIKETNNERYGVDYPTQNKEIRARAHVAMMKAPFRIDKIKKTCTELYGGMGFASKIILNKMQQTNLARYGHISYLSSEAGIQASRDKYGTDYYSQSDECKAKCIASKLARNTFNSSKPEEDFYKSLCELFSANDIFRQYHDDRYPFACDFYILSLDMFIELNLFWTHNRHWFDETNLDDLKCVENWKNKDTAFYRSAVYVWTCLDPAKRQTAESNNLNYVVLWNDQEIKDFLNTITSHI